MTQREPNGQQTRREAHELGGSPELEIIATLRFSFIPIRLANNKKKNNSNTSCWSGCGKIEGWWVAGENVM